VLSISSWCGDVDVGVGDVDVSVGDVDVGVGDVDVGVACLCCGAILQETFRSSRKALDLLRLCAPLLSLLVP